MNFKAIDFIILPLVFVVGCATTSGPPTPEKISLSEPNQTVKNKKTDMISAPTSANLIQSGQLFEEVTNVSSEKALEWLNHGNIRYSKRRLRNDGDSLNDRIRILALNKPHSVIVSCSDARVPPELIFDQKLGEIFVVRTAGISIDTGALASIEFAVREYGINLIYVLGHNHCDVISRSLRMRAGEIESGDALGMLLADVRNNLQYRHVSSSSSQYLKDEGTEVAVSIATSLTDRSQFLKEKFLSGRLAIRVGMYVLESGRVESIR